MLNYIFFYFLTDYVAPLTLQSSKEGVGSHAIFLSNMSYTLRYRGHLSLRNEKRLCHVLCERLHFHENFIQQLVFDSIQNSTPYK